MSKQSQLRAYALNDWLCHYVQSELITAWSRGDPARTCLFQGMEGHGLILNQGRASVRSKCEEGPLPLQISEPQSGDFPARSIPARQAATAPYCPPDPEPRSLLVSALPEESPACSKGNLRPGPRPLAARRPHRGCLKSLGPPHTQGKKRSTFLHFQDSSPRPYFTSCLSSPPLSSVPCPGLGERTKRRTPGCHGDAGPRRRAGRSCDPGLLELVPEQGAARACFRV